MVTFKVRENRNFNELVPLVSLWCFMDVGQMGVIGMTVSWREDKKVRESWEVTNWNFAFITSQHRIRWNDSKLRSHTQWNSQYLLSGWTKGRSMKGKCLLLCLYSSSPQKAPQREGIATNVIWEKIELLFKVSTVSQWNAARRGEVSAAPRGVMDIK